MEQPARKNRRQFLWQTGLTASAAGPLLAMAQASNAVSQQPPNDEPKIPLRTEITLQQTGWNLYSTRFVEPPVWTWQPIAHAAGYVAQFAHARDSSKRELRLNEPRLDMSEVWPLIPTGRIDILAFAVDERRKPLCTAWRKRFWKSPGFDGVTQHPANWDDSIHRAVKHLLEPARDKVEDFERGLPRSLWSCCEDTFTGQRRLLAFPALHHPSFIFAYLEYAAEFPESKHADEARRQARQYADWLLANRLPKNYRCSLFPFSSIEMGRTYGYIEGRNITLFRAARVGEAMIEMFRSTQQQEYLDYARHLANVFVELQTSEGNWPYRVDPATGKVIEDYTSNVVTPARLLALLEQIEPNSKYAATRERAISWVLAGPVRTRRWQGMYEDVGQSVPFRNLQHWDINELIRYLIHFHRGEIHAVETACELNRFIEDQFVVWQTGDEAVSIACPTPSALEQYTCYYPMEAHTATWLWSLVALHRATSENDYLIKAVNAANSIVRGQQPCGAYSTWGYDVRFERPFISVNWPGANAIAVRRLLQLRAYADGLPATRGETHPL